MIGVFHFHSLRLREVERFAEGHTATAEFGLHVLSIALHCLSLALGHFILGSLPQKWVLPLVISRCCGSTRQPSLPFIFVQYNLCLFITCSEHDTRLGAVRQIEGGRKLCF